MFLGLFFSATDEHGLARIITGGGAVFDLRMGANCEH
jgi:hypothetical protein